MKEQNSRKSLYTTDNATREGSSDRIYSNIKESRRNISEDSRNKTITPQFTQNRSFHNDIVMRPYEPRKYPNKVLQPEVMSPTFKREEPRR